MDLLPAKCLSEMEIDDSDIIHQWQLMTSPDQNLVDPFTCKIFPSNDNMTNPSSTLKSSPQVSQISSVKQIKQAELKCFKPCISQKTSPSSSIISFANPGSPLASALDYYDKAKFNVNSEAEPIEIMSLENINSSSVSQISLENPYGLGDCVKRGATRRPEQAQDHILAERKRRERMTQMFIALSAVIPGLKRLDKATVLGDAVKYITKLQKHVKKLEEEAKRNDEESIVTVKKRRLSGSVDGASSDENIDNRPDQSLPEIEVRCAADGNVLVRVYSNNRTGIIKQILSEVEKHDLTMVSNSIMPFGDNKLHITIIAQMDDQHRITSKKLVDNLRTTIANLIT